MSSVKRQDTRGKRTGIWGKWQGETGKIKMQEALDVEEVARCKTRHRKRQGQAKKSKASRGKAPWFYFFQVITYDLLPTSLNADFTGFFFPSGFGVWKRKNRSECFRIWFCRKASPGIE